MRNALERLTTRSKQLIWPLVPVRIRIFAELRRGLSDIEAMCNRNEKFDEFDPRLEIDMDAYEMLTPDERNQYRTELERLKERAHRLDMGTDVSQFLRAKPDWLSFIPRNPLLRKQLQFA